MGQGVEPSHVRGSSVPPAVSLALIPVRTQTPCRPLSTAATRTWAFALSGRENMRYRK
jgi:hypothetical protein